MRKRLTVFMFFFKKMFSQKGWRLILDFEVLYADLKCNGRYFVVLISVLFVKNPYLDPALRTKPR
jgi:hypothetical protein